MPLKPTAAMRKDRAAGQHVKLQHRHFAFIAAVIARIPSSDARLEAAMAFAGALRPTNPHFDRARFFTAVGLADPVIEQAAYPDLEQAAQNAAEFLDGICIGHPVADTQRHEVTKGLFKALKK